MSSNALSHELSVAREAVLAAARLTKTVQSSVSALHKADSSPVTIADFAAQALLISTLHDAFPHDTFIGEEDAGALRASPALASAVHELVCTVKPLTLQQVLDFIDLGKGPVGERCWVMDPVDGTATFLVGKQYAVALALLQTGEEVLAAIAYPNLRVEGERIAEDGVDETGLGVMLSGVKGTGAYVTWLGGWKGPYETQVLEMRRPSRTPCHVVDCEGNRESHRRVVRALCERLGAPFPGTDVWSSHVRYAGLMLGGGDFLVRIPKSRTSWSCVWDHAGAQMLYREVGGCVTDLDGREVDFGAGRYMSRNRGLVVARDAALHAEVLAAARQLMGDDEYMS